MQHHKAGIIGRLLSSFSAQVSGSLCILMTQGVAGLSEQGLER